MARGCFTLSTRDTVGHSEFSAFHFGSARFPTFTSHLPEGKITAPLCRDAGRPSVSASTSTSTSTFTSTNVNVGADSLMGTSPLHPSATPSADCERPSPGSLKSAIRRITRGRPSTTRPSEHGSANCRCIARCRKRSETGSVRMPHTSGRRNCRSIGQPPCPAPVESRADLDAIDGRLRLAPRRSRQRTS